MIPINRIILIFIVGILLIPQTVSAYTGAGPIYAAYLMLNGLGVFPFIIGYFIGKSFKDKKIPKPKIFYLIFIIIFLLLFFIYPISLLTFIAFTLGIIPGKKNWDNKRIAILVIFTIFLFINFLSIFGAIGFVYNMIHISLTTGLTPPSGFIELDNGYVMIENPIEVNGKLAYQASNYSHVIVVYDGNEIWKGKGEPPTSVSELISEGEETQLFGSERSYQRIWPSSFNISNKDCSLVGEPFDRYIICDGEEIGKEYFTVSYPIEINGKLAYVARTGYVGETLSDSFIVYDSKEIGKEYHSVSSPFEFKGKLGFVGYKEPYHAVIVLEDN